MRSFTTAAILAVTVVATGCAHGPPRFQFGEVKMIWVAEQDPDCKDGSGIWRKTLKGHVVVTDTVTQCRVGAIRVQNPEYSPTSGGDDWFQPRYVYARLYDWECPPGVGAPPDRSLFVKNLQAPMACDDEGDPLPSNPLLRPKRPPPTMSAGAPDSSEPQASE
jgi:hypothetical protein